QAALATQVLPRKHKPLTNSEIEPDGSGLFACPECAILTPHDIAKYIRRQELGKHRNKVHRIAPDQTPYRLRAKNTQTQGEISVIGRDLSPAIKTQQGEIQDAVNANGGTDEKEHQMEILIARAYTICEWELRHFCLTHEVAYSQIAPRVAEVL